MGFEYRLRIDPPSFDLDAVCDLVFATTDWQRTETSFVDVPGIGVQRGQSPADRSWPQVADLFREDDGAVLVVCHNQDGRAFMSVLVEFLRRDAHAVSIDDDV